MRVTGYLAGAGCGSRARAELGQTTIPQLHLRSPATRVQCLLHIVCSETDIGYADHGEHGVTELRSYDLRFEIHPCNLHPVSEPSRLSGERRPDTPLERDATWRDAGLGIRLVSSIQIGETAREGRSPSRCHLNGSRALARLLIYSVLRKPVHFALSFVTEVLKYAYILTPRFLAESKMLRRRPPPIFVTEQ